MKHFLNLVQIAIVMLVFGIANADENQEGRVSTTPEVVRLGADDEAATVPTAYPGMVRFLNAYKKSRRERLRDAKNNPRYSQVFDGVRVVIEMEEAGAKYSKKDAQKSKQAVAAELVRMDISRRLRASAGNDPHGGGGVPSPLLFQSSFLRGREK